MDTAAHVIYEMAIHRFALMAASSTFMAIGLTFGLILTQGKGLFSSASGWIAIASMALFFISLVNIITGSSLAANIVYSVGEKGAAKVTSNRSTGSRYNGHDVQGHNVLIKTSGNEVVESYFEDDYFTVYPSSNAVRYPGPDIAFTVHYLRSFPQDFVIVSDDDSPWALSLRCAKLGQMLNEARAKYDFDPASGPYRQSYVDSIHQYIDGKCYSNDAVLQGYRRIIEKVNGGVK
jgi:hypothetical protein